MPEAHHAYAFIQAAKRYCSLRRKKLNQAITVLELFCKPRTKLEVSWSEVEETLGWTGHSEIHTKRTTFTNELRSICFEMCVMSDPETGSVYNPKFISVETKRTEGLMLRTITHVKDQPVQEVIRKKVRQKLKQLTTKGIATLPQDELREAISFWSFLEEDIDAPFQMMGKYRLLRQLGKGATGRVFEAQDETSGQRVALKTLNWRYVSDSMQRNRFLNGAQAMKQLNHPNIAKVITVGEHNGRPYYVQEFAATGSLAEVIAREEQLSHNEKILLLTKIISALVEAHSKGIVHRDLKPENIVIDEKGEPKVTDFDCAYLPERSTLTTNEISGTLYYMSPERFQNTSSKDPDDDVYSFGVTALELLTNSRLRARAEMLRQITEIPVFSKFQIVLAFCITNRANGRYKNAEILLSEWNKALNSNTSTVSHVPVWIDQSSSLNHAGQDLSNTKFDSQFLSRTNFRNAILRGCSFRRCVLSNAVFMGADIRDCCFDGAFMIGARMQGSQVTGTTFRLANLERTVWDNVNLQNVDFSGANFWGAFLAQAINLQHALVKDANFARNLLTDNQKEFLVMIEQQITNTDNYTDFFALAKAKYGTKLPADLWWAVMVDNPDFILLYY